MALEMADTDLMAMEPLLKNLAKVPPEDTLVDTVPPTEAKTAAVVTKEALSTWF